MLTPEERYYFCRVCENCKKDLWDREYCGLTEKAPEFETSCDQFQMQEYPSKIYLRKLKSIVDVVPDKTRQNILDTNTVLNIKAQNYNQISKGILWIVLGVIKFFGFLFLAFISLQKGDIAVFNIVLALTGAIWIFYGIDKIKNSRRSDDNKN